MIRSSQQALRTRSPASASAEGVMVLSELTPSTCKCRIDRPTNRPASKSSISRGDWTEGTEPIVPQHRHCGSPLRQCGKPSAPGCTATTTVRTRRWRWLHRPAGFGRTAHPARSPCRPRKPTRSRAVAGPWLDSEVIDPAVGPGSAQRGGGVRDPGSGQRQRDNGGRAAGCHGAAGRGRAHPDDLGESAQRPPRLGRARAAHRRVLAASPGPGVPGHARRPAHRAAARPGRDPALRLHSSGPGRRGGPQGPPRPARIHRRRPCPSPPSAPHGWPTPAPPQRRCPRRGEHRTPFAQAGRADLVGTRNRFVSAGRVLFRGGTQPEYLGQHVHRRHGHRRVRVCVDSQPKDPDVVAGTEFGSGLRCLDEQL